MLDKMRFLATLITLILLAGGVLVSAQGPDPQGDGSVQAALGTAFTYQGQLKSGGNPVNGNCDFQFSLWDAASGGAQVGATQTKTSVAVSNGLFTVQLDFGSVFTGDARWLAVAVRCPAGSGTYTTLSPRQALTAAPYALGLRPGAFIQGSVGLGGAVGADNTSTSLLSWGVGGTSAGGMGVYGKATATSGTTTGVWGESNSPQGRGVAGYATATSGEAYGVYGKSDSNGGVGVYAIGPWRGVVGYATATSGANVGVYGESASAAGVGVYGRAPATSGTNFGVYGVSASPDGRGVAGWASATSGTNAGVYGESASTAGDGVYGLASATSGYAYGVDGRSASTAGIGVFGWAIATSGTTYGVYGTSTSPSGYAGYFAGRVHVEGNFSASGSKAFKIDHPLDPANRYLYHFAQEAPEVQNVYNGVVTLDANGEATVSLPAYFSALNAGPFRYQLTAIGAPMPNLYIAEEIQRNSFRIAGGVPGKKVSWEVTAVRNDPYLRDHPVQAEEDKPADERGTYLYPEGYGQPPEMGLDYRRHHDLLERQPETPAAQGPR